MASKKDPSEVIARLMKELAEKLEKETGAKVHVGEMQVEEQDDSELDERAKELFKALETVFTGNGEIDSVFVTGTYKEGGVFSATVGRGHKIFDALATYAAETEQTKRLLRDAAECADAKKKLDDAKDPEEMFEVLMDTIESRLSNFLDKLKK